MTNISNKSNMLDGISLIEARAYELTEMDKLLLDEFFDNSNKLVISDILNKFQNVLSDEVKHIESSDDYIPKKKFKICTPAIKFSNSYHEPEVLYYLAEKYNDKFIKLGFDQLGIYNPHFVSSHHNFGEDFHLSYSSSNPKRTFKDSTFGYGLEVDVDLINRKKKWKKKQEKVYTK